MVEARPAVEPSALLLPHSKLVSRQQRDTEAAGPVLSGADREAGRR
jgi:hypothetical protein